MDWRWGSSSRVPALQVQSHQFKPQSHQKKKKMLSGGCTYILGGRMQEVLMFCPSYTIPQMLKSSRHCCGFKPQRQEVGMTAPSTRIWSNSSDPGLVRRLWGFRNVNPIAISPLWQVAQMSEWERMPGPHCFFFFAVLGLELKAYTSSHSTTPPALFCEGFFQDKVSNYFPRLASNHHPPDLCLPSS
jgi:hypothetical protein